jgi:hypothetical protein
LVELTSRATIVLVPVLPTFGNERGDADRARSLLEDARNSAATNGYATIERRATAEL